MKALYCIVAAAGLLLAVPAMAQQQVYGSGGGGTNIWSGAQGTSFSYGDANGFGTSSSGVEAGAGTLAAMGLHGVGGGGLITAGTTSNAGAFSYGSGYAQSQTSGYAGGSASGYGSRVR
jgi:hypothetical protein